MNHWIWDIGLGMGILSVGALAWWLAEHPPGASGSPSSVPSSTPRTSPSSPLTHFRLEASEPQARTGQAILLTATATFAQSPIPAPITIVNTDTRTVVGGGQVIEGHRMIGSASVTHSQQTTASYEARVTLGDIVYRSNPVTVTWSEQATGTNQGRANAAGQTVGLVGPSTMATGRTMTVSAHPQGFHNPVFQFWVLPPGGRWESSGPYTTKPTWSVVLTTPGQWNFAVYAREATAPSHETASQRSQYEAKSGPLLVAVSGGSWVELSGPTTVGVDQSVSLTAIPHNLPNASYQFWFLPAGGSWQSTPWSASPTATFNAGGAGTAQAVVYVKSSAVSGKLYSLPLFVTVGDTTALPAASASVTLSVPATVALGTSFTVTASSTGFSQPVYQLWYRINGGTWNSSGPYQAAATFTIHASTPGTWDITVYCRDASAPANETASQRALFERQSTVYTLSVQ